MGFKRYLYRYDAIYGSPNNWFDNNNNFSRNCSLVA